jgi:ribosomal RNA-processing protein 1
MVKLRVKSHVQQERNMAGVGNKFAPLPPILLNKKKGEPYKPRTPEDVADGKNPFARQLAHGEKDVRDATFRALGKWLGSRSDVDMLDMKKIWKGLFYAMWHADGWDVQEELAETIGGLIHKLKHRVALMYAGVFFITARREWVGIDRHRMDKYLRLVRRFTSHIFRYCADRDWAEAITGDVGEMLMRSALIPTGKGDQGVVDVGLRLHLAEVFVTEMRNVASGKDDVEIGCDPDKENEANGGAPRTVFTRKKGEKRKARVTPTPRPVPPHATDALLKPWAQLLQLEPHKALHKRVLAHVFEKVLEGADGGPAFADPESVDDAEDAKHVRLDAATMKRMARTFIDVGADEGTGDLQRESLYELHIWFRKASKKAAAATGGGEEEAPKKEKKRRKKEPSPEPESEESESEESESEESRMRSPRRTWRARRVSTPLRTPPRRRSPTMRRRTSRMGRKMPTRMTTRWRSGRATRWRTNPRMKTTNPRRSPRRSPRRRMTRRWRTLSTTPTRTTPRTKPPRRRRRKAPSLRAPTRTRTTRYPAPRLPSPPRPPPRSARLFVKPSDGPRRWARRPHPARFT